MSRFFATLLLIVLTIGCARVEVRPIEDGDKEGIRFYRPWPYLWITPTDVKDKTGCNASIIYLPDISQEYIIIPHTGVGSVTIGPTLTQGWSLTALNAAADSKTAEMINAISGLVGNIPKAAAKAVPEGRPIPETLGPGLYAFHFGKNGRVDGLLPVFPHEGRC